MIYYMNKKIKYPFKKHNIKLRNLIIERKYQNN